MDRWNVSDTRRLTNNFPAAQLAPMPGCTRRYRQLVYGACCAAISMLFAGSAMPLALSQQPVAVLQPLPNSAAIEELLEDCWSVVPSARERADAIYQSAGPAGSPSLDYAYAVVLLRQQRLPLAQEVLTGLVNDAEFGTRAMLASSWLALVERRSDGAMPWLTQLAERLPRLTPQAGTQLVRYLGRAVGVMEGPLATRTDKEKLTKLVAELEGKMNEQQQMQFRDARAFVQQSMAQRHQTIAAVRDENKVAEQARAEAERAAVLERIETVERRLTENEQRREELADQARSTLQDLSGQEKPLVTEHRKLQQRARSLIRSIVQLESEQAYLLNLLGITTDPFLADRLHVDLNQIDLLLGRNYRDLDGIDLETAEVQGMWTDVRRQSQQIKAEFAAATTSLKTDQGRLESLRKSLDRKQTQLAEPPRGENTKTRVMRAEATAVTSYLSYSLERERHDLLTRAGVTP